jgi:uncharacterized membrane protein
MGTTSYTIRDICGSCWGYGVDRIQKKFWRQQMMHRIAAIGYAVFGVVAALFLIISIPYLKVWNPSRYTVGFVTVAIAMINILGLVYLIRHREDYERWLLIATGLGNGLSLFVIIFSLAGSFFLEYIFRM